MKQSPLSLADAEHWRNRAEEARTKADELMDAEARATMLQIAEDYIRLAEWAEARAKARQNSN